MPPGWIQHGKSAVLPTTHRLPVPTRQIMEREVSRNDLHIFCWNSFDTTHPSPVAAWSHTFLVTQGLRRVAWGTSLILELPLFKPQDLAITTNTKRQERMAMHAGCFSDWKGHCSCTDLMDYELREFVLSQTVWQHISSTNGTTVKLEVWAEFFLSQSYLPCQPAPRVTLR